MKIVRKKFADNY